MASDGLLDARAAVPECVVDASSCFERDIERLLRPSDAVTVGEYDVVMLVDVEAVASDFVTKSVWVTPMENVIAFV